jgi:tetratricopeptide (TPR) repeat protein
MDAVLPRLNALKPPFFLWVHFYDPHLPYVPPAPYAARLAGRPYDGEIAFMDAEVGRLLAALRNKGDAPIVVLAADHGESLGEHGENGHGVFVYQATQHVPLIFRGPRIAVGATVAPAVGLIDVAPTLLDLAGLPPIAGIDGRSLRPFLRGGTPPPRDYEMESYYPTYAYGWAALRALVSGPYKYVDAPRRELYELPTDPREVRDLSSARRGRLLDLARALDLRAGALASIDADDDPAMEERRAALSSLGYLGGSKAATVGGIDPKDGIKLLPDLDTARLALQTGRPGDALQPLQRLLAKNPGNVPAMLALGQAQLGLGKPADAVATFRKVTSASPNNSLAWFELGNAEAASAATDPAAHAAARGAYERALALSPRHAETYLSYAALLATRPDEALRILQRARQLEVADPVIEAELGVLELMRGQTAAARTAFERALALNPRQVEALEGLGKIHYAAGEYREAAGFYGRAVEVAPSAALAKTLGAIRLYQLDDRAGARTAFERALALTLPGDPDAATLRSLIAELSK